MSTKRTISPKEGGLRASLGGRSKKAEGANRGAATAIGSKAETPAGQIAQNSPKAEASTNPKVSGRQRRTIGEGMAIGDQGPQQIPRRRSLDRQVPWLC